jgi:capsular polysaccharide biosynthesis protein
MREVHDMDRMHDAAEKKFAAIQEKMMVAAVSRASAMSDSASIRVVEAAAPPNEANWPRTKLLLGAALGIGLIAGVLLALLMDLFKGRVHRFRLAGEGELELYATVRTDHGFVADLFGLPMLPVGDARLLWLE